MRDWKKYYNKEQSIVKTTLKQQLNRIPDKQDYSRVNVTKRLNTNLIDIYLDGKFIKSELLIPEKKIIE